MDSFLHFWLNRIGFSVDVNWISTSVIRFAGLRYTKLICEEPEKTINRGIIKTNIIIIIIITVIIQLLVLNVNYLSSFFFYQGFLYRHWRFTGQQGKGEDHLLFHSTTSTRSRSLRHSFATSHVRWLSRIFNRNACVYQIDDAIFVCLLDELKLDFCYSELTLETGGFELASIITLVLQANRLTKCRNGI